MNTPDVAQIVRDLKAWYPLMRENTEPVAPSTKYSHAHTTGLQADSQPERYAYATDRLNRDIQELREIATVLAHGTNLTGATIDVLLALIVGSARTLAAWPDLYADLQRVHARWQAVCDPDEETSTHLCPSCGSAQLRWRHTQKAYACPACEYAGTAEHVANLRAHVIRQSDTWITRTQACTLFDLTREALRWHVRAGHIAPEEGKYNTAQLRDLPRRT